jgi:hypothetical protein
MLLESEDADCLTLAMKTAGTKFVTLLSILPISLMLVEIINVYSLIRYSGETAELQDGLKVARSVIFILISLMFVWFTLGAVHSYYMKNATAIWWIVTGVETSTLFILLSIFQFVTPDDTIWTSYWTYAIAIVMVGIVTLFVLTRHGTRIPQYRWMSLVKGTQLIFFSMWLGYNPDNDFDSATVVIFIISCVLGFIMYNRGTKSDLVWGLIFMFELPGIILILSLYNGVVDKDLKIGMEWGYLIALLLTMFLYLFVVLRSLIGCRIKLDDKKEVYV